YKKLKDENKQACDLMLLYSEDLRLAHRMKEWFYDICQMKAYRQQQREIDDWVANALNCGIEEFEDCARTYRTWRKEILNAFKYELTNSSVSGPGYSTVHHRIKWSVMRRLIWHTQNQ
ncbi:transposase, partial [Hungatella effluvii]